MHGISALGEDIFGLITKHGYLGFFGLMAVEEAGVPLPIPGDLLLVFVGYKIFTGKMVLWKAILTTMAATTLGSTFLYTVFKYGGRPIAKKYGKYILISHHDLAVADNFFNKYVSLVLNANNLGYFFEITDIKNFNLLTS